MKYPLSVNSCADGSFSIDDSDGKELVSVYDEECACVNLSLEEADDIVLKSNALAGVENPEAVKELLDTVRNWQQSDGEDVVINLALELASVAIQFTEEAE